MFFSLFQILTLDTEGHTDTPIEEESLHLQSTSPEPGSTIIPPSALV